MFNWICGQKKLGTFYILGFWNKPGWILLAKTWFGSKMEGDSPCLRHELLLGGPVLTCSTMTGMWDKQFLQITRKQHKKELMVLMPPLAARPSALKRSEDLPVSLLLLFSAWKLKKNNNPHLLTCPTHLWPFDSLVLTFSIFFPHFFCFFV